MGIILADTQEDDLIDDISLDNTDTLFEQKRQVIESPAHFITEKSVNRNNYGSFTTIEKLKKNPID